MPAFRTFLAVLLTLLAGCSATPTAVPRAPDPLAERLHDTLAGEALSREQLVQRMLAADVVYLGEKHDSRRHHEIQRELLEELAARGRSPALGLEIFPRSDNGLLMGYVTWAPNPHMRHDAESAEAWLRAKLGWQEGGPRDGSWASYGPLLESARAHEMATFGIDLPVSLRSRISRVGEEGLTASERALLAPTGFEDPGYESLMLAKLKAAHCGFGSPEYLGRLYDNWVARNDTMARAIVDALDDATAGPVVVIVGAGHTEYGLGVVERVAALRPDVEQVNLGLTELAFEPQPLVHYTAAERHEGRDFGPAHRYLWFTEPEGEPVDHCAGFHAAMGEEAS